MTPDVTVVANTFRPGGIDVLLAGMRDQTYPRDKFEVVLVDHRYERRHREVMDLARSYGVNLIHVPEHRRNGKWGVNSSAYTTGFAVARGHIIIVLVDWTYAPPGWIEAHLRRHDGGANVYVVGPYYYHAVGVTAAMHAELAAVMPARVRRPWADYTRQPSLRTKRAIDPTANQTERDAVMNIDTHPVLAGDVFDEISAFEDGLFDPAWIDRMPPLPDNDPGDRDYQPPGLVSPFNAHLKNESVRRSVVYFINGVDVWSERGGRMAIDTDFGVRLSALGVPTIWEPDARAHCVNPRYSVCRVMPCGATNERIDGRWSQEDCRAFMIRRQTEIAEDRSLIPAPAPYTLTDLARRLEPWRTADIIDTSGLDVPDVEFYGREIWPDSPYVVPAPGVRRTDHFDPVTDEF